MSKYNITNQPYQPQQISRRIYPLNNTTRANRSQSPSILGQHHQPPLNIYSQRPIITNSTLLNRSITPPQRYNNITLVTTPIQTTQAINLNRNQSINSRSNFMNSGSSIKTLSKNNQKI